MESMDPNLRKESRRIVRSWESDVRNLDRLARLMDSAYRIPVIGVRMGWDSIVGLIPGVGDILGVAPLFYYLKLARDYRLGGAVYTRLLANQGIDFLVGLVPVIGDILDIGWKANLRNAKLLAEKIRERGRANE